MGVETRNNTRGATPKISYRGRGTTPNNSSRCRGGRNTASLNNISIDTQSPTKTLKPARVVHTPIAKINLNSNTQSPLNLSENQSSVDSVEHNSMDNQPGSSFAGLLDSSNPNNTKPPLDLQSSVPPIFDNRGTLNTPLVNTNPSGSANSFSMTDLVAIMQQTVQATKDEFIKELASVRESVSQIGSRNNSLNLNNSGLAGNRPNDSTPNRQPNLVNTNSQSNNFSQYDSNVKLEKWKIIYDGNGSVSDFLFKVETLSRRSKCSEEQLLNNFHVLLEGKAETWYWWYMKNNRNVIFPSLRQAITREFGHLESDHDILMKITMRKQQMKESYDDFHTAVVSMNSRLRNPMSESSLIDIMKQNLTPNLKFLLFNSLPRTIEDLKDTARRAELVLRDNKMFNPYFGNNRNVSEIDTSVDDSAELDTLDPQIEAIHYTKRNSKPDYSRIQCWNCLKYGHSYIYCNEEIRSPFCFKCGQKGVLTPKCPNDHLQGNRKIGEMTTGDTRLSQHTPSPKNH